jgi:hypothetical protein
MRAVCSLVCLALLLVCLRRAPAFVPWLVQLAWVGARRVLPLDCLVFSVCCYLCKYLYIRGYTPVCNLMRMFYSSNN